MRKKLIIVGIVAVVLVVAILVLSLADIGMANVWLDGQTEDTKLGDLVIPVTATGLVEPAKIIQIKSKASGRVLKTNVVEGQMVKADELLLELDPVDETRNVDARQADLDRGRSALEKAKIALKNAVQDLPLQTQSAKARLDDAAARYDDAAFRWQKMQGYVEGKVAGDVEAVTTKAAFLTAKAARDLAEVDLQRSRNNEEILLKSAQEDVKQAEAALTATEKAKAEADLRFKETKVIAPSDGMVYSILIQEGEMIQSGTMSFTGGSVLMILADTSAMFVMAQVDEADIGSIRKIAPEYARPGLTQKLSEAEYQQKADEIAEQFRDRLVDVTVDAYRRENYRSVIERILPEPLRVSGALAFKVRLRLVGEDLQKLMGLQADLSFTTQKESGLVLIKNEALRSEGRNCFVYVPVPGQRREEKKVPVEIGSTDGTFTEIKSGLKPGDPVYTKRPQKTEREKEQEKAKGERK